MKLSLLNRPPGAPSARGACRRARTEWNDAELGLFLWRWRRLPCDIVCLLKSDNEKKHHITFAAAARNRVRSFKCTRPMQCGNVRLLCGIFLEIREGFVHGAKCTWRSFCAEMAALHRLQGDSLALRPGLGWLIRKPHYLAQLPSHFNHIPISQSRIWKMGEQWRPKPSL